MAKLGDVCTIYAGTGFPIKYQGCTEGDFPFYKVGDIAKNVTNGFSFLNLCDNYIDSEVCTAIKGTIIPSRTVVFAKIGEAVKLNRRAITSVPCLIDNNAMGIKPDENIISLNYFYYFMCHIKLEKFAEATTVPSVKKSVVETIEIPLPPLETQKQIAATLDKVTALIDMHKRQLELLEELVKGRFVEMFGDTEINSNNFPIHKLNEVCTVGSSKRIYQEEQSNSGVPFLRISNLVELIDNDRFGSELFIPKEKYNELLSNGLVPKPNDILVTSRGTLGKCYIMQDDDKFYFQDGMISWLYNLDDSITALYLTKLFDTRDIKKQIENLQSGSTVAYLSIAMLKKLNIVVPPLDLQHQFAAFVTQTDKSKSSIQQSLAKLETLKKSLMQEYFG